MSLTALIVDDSAVMRTFIRRILDATGVEIDVCHEAADGRAALRIVSDHHLDFILTDINMPGMDGEQFARELLAMGRIPKTPLLVVSTDSTEPRVHTMMQLGARGYLRKPFSPEAMRSAIDSALGVTSAVEVQA